MNNRLQNDMRSSCGSLLSNNTIPSSFPGWLPGLHCLRLALVTVWGCCLDARHGEGFRLRLGGQGARQTLVTVKIPHVDTRWRQLFNFLLAHERDYLVQDLKVRPVMVCCGVAALDVLKQREESLHVTLCTPS